MQQGKTFRAIDEIFWQSVFSLLMGGGRCYRSSETVQNYFVQKQAKKKIRCKNRAFMHNAEKGQRPQETITVVWSCWWNNKRVSWVKPVTSMLVTHTDTKITEVNFSASQYSA